MADKTDDFLEHYGVKGMKWGVKNGVGGKPRSRKEIAERNRRKDAKNRRRTLSDKDLDSLVNRLEKEKKLKSLVDDDLLPGKTLTQQIIRSSGTKVAGAVVAGTSMYVIRGVLTKNWGLGELANNIPKFKK